MRRRSKNRDISLHAIAGTQVVLLGLNASEEAAEGLLGFSIFKQKGKSGRKYSLGGGKIFDGVHRENERGKIRSDQAPIQAFMWSDYEADPNTTYTYTAVPVYGEPGALEPGKAVKVTITTEDPEDKIHAVHFNRGAAGSQAFSRQFGKYRRSYLVEQHGRKRATAFVKPETISNREAYTWLSRGLEEAMLGFIAQAKGPEYSIRAAVYEFTYLPAIQAFVNALERGVDVKIVHHAKRESLYRLKQNYDAHVTVTWEDDIREPKSYKNREVVVDKLKDSVSQAADAAISQIGLINPKYLKAFDEMMIERTITQISHNKFVVLLKNNKPIQVWTGSTNFTDGGIFGQSNVGHIVRDAKVARKYLDYWKKLSTDPKKKSAKTDPPDEGMRNWTVLNTPDLTGPPRRNSITPIFSPRLTKDMLNWYADQMGAAENSVFFTAAFSVDQRFLNQLAKKKVTRGQPYQRYVLLEGISGLMKKKYPIMAKCPQNRIAWGDLLRSRGDGEDQLIETLTGLNENVEYLHTKYMLIDPLSDDPVVISGSANFSEASTIANDENMLIIRGNTRVADIFLGEFMRIFNHFHSRNRSNALSDEMAAQAHYLVPDDSWTEPYYTEGTQEMSERLLFG